MNETTTIDVFARVHTVFKVLDDLLGDTDPDCGDMTDDEIKTEEPLFWACRELCAIWQSEKMVEIEKKLVVR